MKTYEIRRHLPFLTAVLVITLAATLVACSESSVGPSYDEPLELTGVQYQSPDSVDAPERIGPGDLIALQGNNMQAVARVYFNGIEASFNPALASQNHLVVSVPGDLPFGSLDPDSEEMNTIRVSNRASEAVLDFPVLPSAPQVRRMSNEYALPGSEVTLTGQFLYLIDSITFPDGTIISGDDVAAEDDGSAVTLTIPSETAVQEGPIAVETIGGVGSSDPAFFFHDSRGMIFDLPDIQHWQWWSAMHPFDDNYDFETPASHFRDTRDGEFVIIRPQDDIGSGDNSWWDPYRSINLNPVEWVDPANLDEPAGNFALKFEMGLEGDWTTGTFQIVPNPDTEAFVYRYEPWVDDGPVSYDGWRTVTIPLDEFRTDGGRGTRASLGGLLGTDGVPGATSIRLINDTDGAISADIIFAIDKIRVVRIAE